MCYFCNQYKRKMCRCQECVLIFSLIFKDTILMYFFLVRKLTFLVTVAFCARQNGELGDVSLQLPSVLAFFSVTLCHIFNLAKASTLAFLRLLNFPPHAMEFPLLFYPNSHPFNACQQLLEYHRLEYRQTLHCIVLINTNFRFHNIVKYHQSSKNMNHLPQYINCE